jgi:hypothetical protein
MAFSLLPSNRFKKVFLKRELMKRYIFIFSFLCLCSVFSAELNLPFLGNAQPSSIFVNNRILATVNGKTISVIDVMKKMDVFLNRVYPQAADSPNVLYQFYSTHWRETLEQMIDAELILLDSEGKDMKVSDSDVRESIQERFGPNVMANLDKLGLTYEETKKMIHTELVVQRMMWFRVNSKAILSVNPQDVKKAYRDYCANNPPIEEWKYQVLSIRAKDQSVGESIAKKAFSLWKEEKKELVAIADALKSSVYPELKDGAIQLVNTSEQKESAFSIQLSEDYSVNDKSLSQSHREVLKTLKKGTLSEPIPQVNRFDNSVVFRLFHLKDHTKKEPPTFKAISEKLENELINKAIDKETRAYIAKVRERLSFDASILHENIPDGFQPFELK